MLKSLEDIQVFLDMNYKMFGQAVSKYTILLVLCACNVMTAFDPPFERLFYEDFNGGFRLKGGGVYTCRDIINFLLSKVGICNMLRKIS
jgi:hypothetical protein